MRGSGRRLVSLVALGILALPSVGVQAASAHVRSSSSPGHVFFDTTGTCPAVDDGVSWKVCRKSRAGNAVAATFETIHRPWGVAYSFNCGATAKDVLIRVGVPDMDGDLPSAQVFRHARSGRGWHMMTPAAIRDLQPIPSYWSTLENIELHTTCTWHVIGVKGIASAVAAHVPAIPALQQPK